MRVQNLGKLVLPFKSCAPQEEALISQSCVGYKPYRCRMARRTGSRKLGVGNCLSRKISTVACCTEHGCAAPCFVRRLVQCHASPAVADNGNDTPRQVPGSSPHQMVPRQYQEHLCCAETSQHHSAAPARRSRPKPPSDRAQSGTISLTKSCELRAAFTRARRSAGSSGLAWACPARWNPRASNLGFVTL